MTEVPYAFKIAQLEKAKGELRVLASLWYESCESEGGEVYSNIHPMIENFIDELENHCG